MSARTASPSLPSLHILSAWSNLRTSETAGGGMSCCGTRNPWPRSKPGSGVDGASTLVASSIASASLEKSSHTSFHSPARKSSMRYLMGSPRRIQVVGAKEKRIGRLPQPRCRLLLPGAVSRVRIPLQREPLRLRVHRLCPNVDRVARTSRPVYAEDGVPGGSRHLVESLREERLRLEQPSVASRGIWIGGLVMAPLRGGCPLEWRRESRAPHWPREDRARRLEEGASTPPPRRWSDGEASGSRATDWAARRKRRQARVWCGHARERWAGWEPVAPAPGCSLGRPARGVLRPVGNVMRSCAPRF